MSKKKVSDTSENYEDMLGVRNSDLAPATLSEFVGLTDEITNEKEAWEELWKGMPTFNNSQHKPVKTLTVNFGTEENFQAFIKKLELKKVSTKTKSIWYPEIPLLENSLYRFVDEGDM